MSIIPNPPSFLHDFLRSMHLQPAVVSSSICLRSIVTSLLLIKAPMSSTNGSLLSSSLPQNVPKCIPRVWRERTSFASATASRGEACKVERSVSVASAVSYVDKSYKVSFHPNECERTLKPI